MPGPNTTGTPNILDLMLGRGEVFVADLKTDGTPKGFRHVGNVPSISVGTSIETKEHFSSMSGLKAQDLQVVLSDSRSISLQLEELNHQNLAIAFSGETATETNAGYAGFSEHLMVDDGELLAGHWYEIKNAAGLRAVDVDGGILGHGAAVGGGDLVIGLAVGLQHLAHRGQQLALAGYRCRWRWLQHQTRSADSRGKG